MFDITEEHRFLQIDVPVCPSGTSINHVFSFPSTSLIFACLSITCFIFSIIIAFHYNSFTVFNKKMRTQTISNTLWILYYLTLGLRASSNTIRFSMDREKEIQIEKIFFIASLTLHGFTALTLSLSLNHQRRYRSTTSTQSTHQQQKNRESDPLLQIQQDHGSRSLKLKSMLKRSKISISEIIIIFLFILFLVFLYVEIDKENQIFYDILLTIFIVQHIPVLVLVVMIAFSGKGEGPTQRSRIFIILGAIFNLCNYLPLYFWSEYLPGGCPMYIVSYVDFIQIFDFASLLFFFLFLRSEYSRNVEECIWTAVSQSQDTFDFRKF
ncbi:hypothetical protein DLAC_06296 [Tieghemostelium lacteum]|uniref:Transmembrane protein n=1 Tax=Tieghemostelium lacteum TaxID=361077 RepID=A0A151ZEE2_TIELA|nr:hypothetical protein DLAC_06296 [Tieghemostelium lacteum]|eukprot:KYQ92332.1 hypothetical protein DLAC_06296 [Tieghemostelium lacteum]